MLYRGSTVYQNRRCHRYSSLMDRWQMAVAFLTSYTQIIVRTHQMYHIHNSTLAKKRVINQMKNRWNELSANGQIAYSSFNVNVSSKLKTKSKLERYLNKVKACSQWSASKPNVQWSCDPQQSLKLQPSAQKLSFIQSCLYRLYPKGAQASKPSWLCL